MTVTVYQSTDASAPVLNGSAGSLIALLEWADSISSTSAVAAAGVVAFVEADDSASVSVVIHDATVVVGGVVLHESGDTLIGKLTHPAEVLARRRVLRRIDERNGDVFVLMGEAGLVATHAREWWPVMTPRESGVLVRHGKPSVFVRRGEQRVFVRQNDLLEMKQ